MDAGLGFLLQNLCSITYQLCELGKFLTLSVLQVIIYKRGYN